MTHLDGDHRMQSQIKVLLPWNASNFMPLNAFHPIYRFLIEKEGTHSYPIENLTFNENLLLDAFLLDKGCVLQECLRDLSQKINLERKHKPEYQEVWEFFDIHEALAGEISRCDLQILHTTPLSLGIKPFIYHLESFETLFYPWSMDDPCLISASPEKVQSLLGYLRVLLESPQCLAIVSHLRGTLERFKSVFQSERILEKLDYCPLGFPVWKKNEEGKKTFRFVFSSIPTYMNISDIDRSGIRSIFQFMKIWLEKFPEDEFILCLPPMEENIFFEIDTSNILLNPQVYNFGNQYLNESEFKNILISSDFVLLPSYHLQSASILQSMGAGVIPIVTNINSVEELGLDSSNSIIIDIIPNLHKTQNSLFGEIFSLHEFISQSSSIAESMLRQLEGLKKNHLRKIELSQNAQNTIRKKYDPSSASLQFIKIVQDRFDNFRKLSKTLAENNRSKPTSDFLSTYHSLYGIPEDLVPLRPVTRDDYDTLPTYRSFWKVRNVSLLFRI